MQGTKRTIFLIALLASLSGFLPIVAPAFAASKEKVLYSFDGTDGANPYAVNLAFDMSGNLYGTTAAGGTGGGGGTVFELMPNENGTWSEKVLRNFSYTQGNGGALPVAGVILDSSGNLYSTTSANGATGNGTVFELTPGTNGHWTEEVLTDFGDGKHGSGPFGGVIFDSSGNLYGAAGFGGADGDGTVFQLTPGSDGKWITKVLHSFRGTDGSRPFASVIFDPAGNLYGTASTGGRSGCMSNLGCGTVFELTPGVNGTWTAKVLHRFGKGDDGQTPDAGLILDASGNLYGTTSYGGTHGSGVVFELVPGANGKWTEKILHNFCAASGCPDGANPYAGLVFDGAGNLYGTTVQGGTNGEGVAFKLTPGGNGTWKEQVLHTFGAAGDGAYPVGGLVFDAAGNLYGTTEGGGISDNGIVFEITP